MKTAILEYFVENFGLDDVSALDMYHAYLSTLEGYRDRFDELSDKSDFDGLRQAFHSVKGCALNCGDTEMAEAALEGERAAKGNDMDACRTQIPLVLSLVDARLTER